MPWNGETPKLPFHANMSYYKIIGFDTFIAN